MSLWKHLFCYPRADILAVLRVMRGEVAQYRAELGQMWREMMRNQQQYNEAIAALTREVSESNDVNESAIKLIQGLRKQLNDIIVQNDGLVPVEQIQSLASSLDVRSRALADAITANTDSATGSEATGDDVGTQLNPPSGGISNAPTGPLNPDPQPPGKADRPKMGMGSAPAAGPDGTTHSAPELQTADPDSPSGSKLPNAGSVPGTQDTGEAAREQDGAKLKDAAKDAEKGNASS